MREALAGDIRCPSLHKWAPIMTTPSTERETCRRRRYAPSIKAKIVTACLQGDAFDCAGRAAAWAQHQYRPDLDPQGRLPEPLAGHTVSLSSRSEQCQSGAARHAERTQESRPPGPASVYRLIASRCSDGQRPIRSGSERQSASKRCRGRRAGCHRNRCRWCRCR